MAAPSGIGSGFTLVELLVVIVIIAILAGLLLPVLGAARNRARVTRARAEVAELASAWQAYWDFYGEWPSGISEINSNAVAILQGSANTDDNPENMMFMTFSRRAESEGFSDPWGRLYSVEFSPVRMNTQRIGFRTRVHMGNRHRHR